MQTEGGEGQEQFSNSLISIFKSKLDSFAKLKEKMQLEESRYRDQIAEKDVIQGKLKLSAQEFEKSLAVEKNLFNSMLDETKNLYEKKLEKLSANLNELKRMNEEKSEQILLLEKEKYSLSKALSEAKFENQELFESMKAQMDFAEGALKKLFSGQEGMQGEFVRLRENFDEALNKLFTVEKELLSVKKREVKSFERLKGLTEDSDLTKFENDHLVCLLENKENEIKELRMILAENEKLLEKFQGKYSSTVDRLERSLGELQGHLEKFPQPDSFNNLRGELEHLREDNVELVKRNLYLEEAIKAAQQPVEVKSEDLSGVEKIVERIEKISLGGISEMVAALAGLQEKEREISSELQNEMNLTRRLKTEIEELRAENAKLENQLKLSEHQRLDFSKHQEPSKKNPDHEDDFNLSTSKKELEVRRQDKSGCHVCGCAMKKTDIGASCKRCRNLVHKKCLDRKMAGVCFDCAS